MSTMIVALSEITMGLQEHELTDESNLLLIKNKTIWEKAPWIGKKKENSLVLGLKNSHTSETVF